jgi:hypothetical protein
VRKSRQIEIAARRTKVRHDKGDACMHMEIITNGPRNGNKNMLLGINE